MCSVLILSLGNFWCSCKMWVFMVCVVGKWLYFYMWFSNLLWVNIWFKLFVKKSSKLNLVWVRVIDLLLKKILWVVLLIVKLDVIILLLFCLLFGECSCVWICVNSLVFVKGLVR